MRGRRPRAGTPAPGSVVMQSLTSVTCLSPLGPSKLLCVSSGIAGRERLAFLYVSMRLVCVVVAELGAGTSVAPVGRGSSGWVRAPLERAHTNTTACPSTTGPRIGRRSPWRSQLRCGWRRLHKDFLPKQDPRQPPSRSALPSLAAAARPPLDTLPTPPPHTTQTHTHAPPGSQHGVLPTWKLKCARAQHKYTLRMIEARGSVARRQRLRRQTTPPRAAQIKGPATRTAPPSAASSSAEAVASQRPPSSCA
jgi:hypothetical protein